MDREFKPALISVTAIAFGLDALYAVMKPLIPPVRAGSRWAEIAETLKRGTKDGRESNRWPPEFQSLFEDRDDAVHFGESFKTPVPHPRGTNVAPEYVTWSPESASRAVDLGLRVLGSLVKRPQPSIAEWAENYGGLLAELVGQRQGLPRGENGP